MNKNKFADLVFYEIYPTSFYDSNGDGIGDLKGIEMKLDYVKELGFNAIWFNPFFKSPFHDGGYDVEDFFDVDPKFGNLDDFKSMVKKAHELGIKVILDLVAGHASSSNKEFIKSAQPERNDCSDMFIWSDCIWTNRDNIYTLISGMYDRDGCYLVNFFAHQPAFNYGFDKIDQPWQMHYTDKRCEKARNYLLKIMRFWLSLGADGFRVDMADSLVKHDDERLATIKLWNYFYSVIRKEYPDAFFVSEWSFPDRAFESGFDCDFVLDHWDNFYHRMFRSNEKTRGISQINSGNHTEKINLDLAWRLEAAKKYGKLLGNISGNHDTTRIANYLSGEKLKMFYITVFGLPGIPFVLYGDELEMKSSPISSKDGGYGRTGTRIPMIWDNKTKNHGFSRTNGDTYLPFWDVNKISVEDAIKDKKSIYNFIKKLIALRKENKDLITADYELKTEDRVIRILRGKTIEVVLNFSDDEVAVDGEVLISSSEIKNGKLKGYNAAILKK